MEPLDVLLALLLVALLVAIYFVQRWAGAPTPMRALFGRPRHPVVYLLTIPGVLVASILGVRLSG